MGYLTSLAEEILATAKFLDESLPAGNQPAGKINPKDFDRYAGIPPGLSSARDSLFNQCAYMRNMLESPETAHNDITSRVSQNTLACNES